MHDSVAALKPLSLEYFNLKTYIKKYEDVFSKETCKSIISKIEELDWRKHSYAKRETGKNFDVYTQFENDLEVTSQNFFGKDDMTKTMWNVLNQYVVHDMSYSKEWFGGWEGFTIPRFNRYSVGTEMRIHCDHIKSTFDGSRRGIPILTILGALNDDYEGGELYICNEPFELKQGEVVIFPSVFLYPHAVLPVKSGTRYSFVSWVW